MFAQKDGRTRALYVLLGLIVVGFAFLMVAGTVMAEVNQEDSSVDNANKFLEPGESVTFQVGIRMVKDGTDPYETDVNLTISSASSGWTNEFVGVHDWHIDASGWKYTTVRVTAPTDGEVDDYLETYVFIANSNGTDTGSILFRTTIEQIYQITLNITGTTEFAGDVEEDVAFILNVWNLGNGDDTITLAHTQTPGDLEVTYSDPGAVSGGSKKNTPITVTIGPYAKAKEYYLTFTATSENLEETDTQQINITVNPNYEYTFSCDDTTQSTVPELEASYSFTLTNLGNSKLTYNLSFTGDTTGETGIWDINLNPATKTLDVNQTQVFIVEITPPEDSPAEGPNKTKSFTITATPSEGLAQAGPVDIAVDTTVLQEYEAHMSGSSPSIYTLPEEQVDVEISVFNDGNAEDRFNLYSGSPSGWTVQFIPQTVIDIDRTTFLNITARITIGQDAPYGGQDIDVWAISDGDPMVNASLRLTIYVAEKFDSKLTNNDTATKSVFTKSEDQTVSFNLTLENTGNRRTTFDLNLNDQDATGWNFAFDNTEPQLDPAQVTDIQLTITAKQKHEAGNYVFKINATMEDSNYSNQLTYTVTVTTYREFSIISVQINESKSDRFPHNSTVTTSGDVYADIVVKNIGNGDDTVELKMDLPTGWSDKGFIPGSIIDIDYNMQDTVEMKFTIGTEALNQEYPIIIWANSTTEQNAVPKSKTQMVSVQQTFDVEALIQGVNSKETDPEDSVTFQVLIKNEGNGEDNFLIEVDNKLIDWQYTFTPSATLTIEANSQERVNLTVTPDGKASKADYTVIFNASTTGDYDNSQQVIVSVRQLYDFDLACSPSQKIGYPEWTINYTLDVINQGTGPDQITLESEMWPMDTDVIITVENPTVNLILDQINHTKIVVTIPSKIDVDPGTYFIYINGTSDNGTIQDADDIIISQELQLVIKPVFHCTIPSTSRTLALDPASSSSSGPAPTRPGASTGRRRGRQRRSSTPRRRSLVTLT
jgi:uncharacterized membrane protein